LQRCGIVLDQDVNAVRNLADYGNRLIAPERPANGSIGQRLY
jgi:transposase